MESSPPIYKKITSLTTPPNTVLPGGLPVYDTERSEFITWIEKPVKVVDLLSDEKNRKWALRGSIRLDQLEAFGIRLAEKTTQLLFPKNTVRLDAFRGVLYPLQFVFQTQDETSARSGSLEQKDIFLVNRQQDFSSGEQKIVDLVSLGGTKVQKSVLGLYIADPMMFQEANISPDIYPPKTLRLDLPPNHIPSQHTGECSSDSLQTDLFFADGFTSFFAGNADVIYQQFIRSNPRVLFDIDHPDLVKAVASLFQVTGGTQDDIHISFILASMVRRFILIRLMDMSNPRQINSLKVTQTACLIPKGVPKVSTFKGRRKSINLYASMSVHERLLALVGKKFEMKSNFTLDPEGYSQNDFMSMLCKIMRGIQLPLPLFHILLFSTDVLITIPPMYVTSVKFAIYHPQHGGHSLSLFRNNDIWHLQDDNIGIARNIDKDFDLDDFLQERSKLFVSDFAHLPMKSIEFFKQSKLLSANEVSSEAYKRYTYYGYQTRKHEQRVFHIEKESMYGEFWPERDQRIYFCYGSLTEKHTAGAKAYCVSQGLAAPQKPNRISSKESEPAVNANVEPAPKIKALSLSEELLIQLTTPYISSKEAKQKKELLFANISSADVAGQLTAFASDSSKSKGKAVSALVASTYEEDITHQLTGFSRTTDKGK